MGRTSSTENAVIRSAEAIQKVEGNTGPPVFVRAAGLRGVRDPRHARTSTQGTW